MPNNPAWMDSLPLVENHPAADGSPLPSPVPVAPVPAGGSAAPVTPQDNSWMGNLPLVQDHPAAAPLPPQAPGPQHPVSGPSGSLGTDIGRRLGTAATDTLGGLLGFPRLAAEGVDWLGNKVGANVGADQALAGIQQPGGGQLFPDPATAREMAYQTTGATEYQPETTAGKIGQSALTTVMGGAPLGLANGVRSAVAAIPALAGAGATSEIAREAFPDHPAIASMVGAIPGAFMGNMAGNVARRMAGSAGSAMGADVPGLGPSGGSLPPAVANLADAAAGYGIPIAPGQLSDNFFTRNVYDLGGKLPLSGADAFAGKQQAAFENAVGKNIRRNGAGGYYAGCSECSPRSHRECLQYRRRPHDH